MNTPLEIIPCTTSETKQEIVTPLPGCCSIIACNLGVLEELQPHIICLLSSCSSSCFTFASCFSWASSTSGAPSVPSSQINHRGSLDQINPLVSTWLLVGLATSFSIMVVLAPDSPKQKQKCNMAQYPHSYGNIKKKQKNTCKASCCFTYLNAKYEKQTFLIS